jgi:hypothetical protein
MDAVRTHDGLLAVTEAYSINQAQDVADFVRNHCLLRVEGLTQERVGTTCVKEDVTIPPSLRLVRRQEIGICAVA